MGKSRRQKRHFMEDPFEQYRKIRKPTPPATRVHKERKNKKWDWQDELDQEVL
jgi:hypothetical protein